MCVSEKHYVARKRETFIILTTNYNTFTKCLRHFPPCFLPQKTSSKHKANRDFSRAVGVLSLRVRSSSQSATEVYVENNISEYTCTDSRTHTHTYTCAHTDIYTRHVTYAPTKVNTCSNARAHTRSLSEYYHVNGVS